VFIERIKAAEPELVQVSTTWRSKEERREDELSPYEYTIVKATEASASVDDEQEPEDEEEAKRPPPFATPPRQRSSPTATT
jgi:hypothetical protein